VASFVLIFSTAGLKNNRALFNQAKASASSFLRLQYTIREDFQNYARGPSAHASSTGMAVACRIGGSYLWNRPMARCGYSCLGQSFPNGPIHPGDSVVEHHSTLATLDQTRTGVLGRRENVVFFASRLWSSRASIARAEDIKVANGSMPRKLPSREPPSFTFGFKYCRSLPVPLHKLS
jgi:hypothetical protein